MAQVREETGARIIALGEHHNYIGNIKYIRANLEGLKADGNTTFYLEVGANQQPMFDKALSGDVAAQRELRLNYERWWGFYGGTEAAQQRYDMLFDAKNAGLRVLCVDMDDRMDHMQRYNKLVDDETDQPISARLGIGDAVLAGNIKRFDDGQQGFLLVGKAHTYNAAPGGHIEDRGTADEAGYYQSQHGGTTERLNALGIKTASIDFSGVPGGDGSLSKGDGRSSDYNLAIEEEKFDDRGPYHFSTGYRVYWDRLANVYDHAAITDEKFVGKKGVSEYEGLAKDLRGLSTMLDNPAFLKRTPEQQEQQLKKEISRIGDKVQTSFMTMRDDVNINAAINIWQSWMVPKSENNPYAEATWREVIDDNRSLHTPEARQMWERPAASGAAPKPVGQGNDYEAVAQALLPKKSPAVAPAPDNKPVFAVSPPEMAGM